MAGAAASPSPTTQAHAGHVVARHQQIPSALVPVAVLLAVAVGALSLVPSVAQAVWEVPHLVLLGLVVSYGVFAQKKSGGDGDGGGAKDGDGAWNSRYLPDDPLVVVANHEACDDDDDGGESERPLSLPVRRLKPPALESEAGDASDDGIGGETDSSASTAGFWAGASAGHSPPSVLDAVRSRKSIAATAPYSIKSTGFPSYGSPVPRDQSFIDDDGEVTDWDDDEADGPDEMAASSQMSSYNGDFTACGNHDNDDDYYNDGDDGNDGDMSVDEELFELAAQAATEEEDEVDRKADEFIAKFREQIRLQKL
ncbi:hypothetical protein GUJ93_ZPchr0006g42987 [Zizania palustris]|uniref:Uncharacterized protein n=1 Tax=Zizania palustris TaxID=103762 RepID=A0A8J5VHY9_ZIZPA|nr:hypothetical protein GUJ93_ZPchr0006g42987 [Zizania palustris]